MILWLGGSGHPTMWAKFPGGYLSPLRPKNALEFEEQGMQKKFSASEPIAPRSCLTFL